METNTVFDALGHRFTISGDDPDLLAQARALVAALASGAQAPNVRTYDLAAGAAVSWSHVMQSFVGNINFGAIWAATGSLLLHAGGVGRADGSVVVVSGPTGSGKSTLTARLVQGGAAYLTDETLCLDPDSLRATPFRKPLAVKTGSQALFPELEPAWITAADRAAGVAWMVAPAALCGAAVPDAVLSPELLIFTTYQEGAALQVERLDASEAAYRLGRESSMLSKVRGGPLPALARLANRAPAYRLIHSDVDAAADQVRALWDAA